MRNTQALIGRSEGSTIEFGSSVVYMANLGNSATNDKNNVFLSVQKIFVVFQILCYPSVMENTFLHFKKVTSDRDD